MNSASLGTAILSVILLAIGGFAWSLQLQPALEIDASALATLPMRIDVYDGEDIPLESTVESVLRADFNLVFYFHLNLVEYVLVGEILVDQPPGEYLQRITVSLPVLFFFVL